jgi:putative selenate reductase
MRPIPFKELTQRIFSEFRKERSIFGIPEFHFFRKQNNATITTFNDRCDSPIGPAAGPHTQMTQNIVASYFAGGRFMELKTVQKLDNLEIDKPCIDARDECYNTEWSTEFSLEKAYDEYVKAWVLLHLLEEVFQLRLDGRRSFIFNMSVGYDLEGIKTEKMDRFINNMIDASGSELFQRYLRELDELIEEGSFLEGTGYEHRLGALKGLSERIPAEISPSVTLSTMHGCPPDEQEAICSYMLTEKKIDTYVKLNPTLLGYETVRSILDSLEYEYLHISPDSFSHDLQYDDAVAMLKRLQELAAKEGKAFGIKLSNTLGSINDQGQLPGDDMFMSGRALFPLTIRVAEKLAQEFDGSLPISYSGGANAFNVRQLFETGIRPITLATDLLKPGGYMRLKEMALQLETAGGWEMEKIDPAKVKALAERSMEADYTQKEFRGEDTITTGEPLPLYDCYVAPCVSACPVHQDVPEYIRLVGQGRYEEALRLIYETNALPNITGHICDHQCMFNCTRLDYEGAVDIRDMKRIAAQKGWEQYMEHWKQPQQRRKAKVAVVGAGPAGLGAAYFLAREGFPVKVFERQQSAGGVVEHVVPAFRIPHEAVEKDVQFIKEHGVEFEFGADPAKLKAEALKQQGYDYIFLGIGAEKDKGLRIEGKDDRVMESLAFLRQYRKDPSSVSLGEHVVIVGGGDVAMDCAQACGKTPGVKKVTVVYRRAKKQMPAEAEEFRAAQEAGAEFRFLRNPESISDDGTLTLRVMKLGEKDASGRARPEATDETETLRADHVITAIGQDVDSDYLKSFGIQVDERGNPIVDEQTLETKTENVFIGGDAQTGASSIIAGVAGGKQAAEAIIRKEEPGWSGEYRKPKLEEKQIKEQVLARKGAALTPSYAEGLTDDREIARREESRCLQCNYICNKCVEVCPNRANIVLSFDRGAGFAESQQILHLDALCNECGNCATFCPWEEGKPYKEKLTVFNLKEDFEGSENPGFYREGETLHLRLDGKVQRLTVDSRGTISGGSVDPRAAEMIGKVVREYDYLLGEVLP